VKRIVWERNSLDQAVAEALSDMLRLSSTVPLQVLDVTCECGMDEGTCRRIFQSMRHSTALRRLLITLPRSPKSCSSSTLDGAVTPTSSLRHLVVHCTSLISREAMANLAHQLRANTTLLGLRLSEPDRPPHQPPRRPVLPESLPPPPAKDPERFRPLADALSNFNCTLRFVDLNDLHPRSEVVGTMLSRNQCVRTAVEHLHQRDYRVSPTALVPNALGLVRRFPTLLYRLLRRSDLNELADRLLRRRNDEHVHHGRAASIDEE
jgi:hypothetical protein